VWPAQIAARSDSDRRATPCRAGSGSCIPGWRAYMGRYEVIHRAATYIRMYIHTYTRTHISTHTHTQTRTHRRATHHFPKYNLKVIGPYQFVTVRAREIINTSIGIKSSVDTASADTPYGGSPPVHAYIHLISDNIYAGSI